MNLFFAFLLLVVSAVIAVLWFFHYMIYEQGFVPAGYWDADIAELFNKPKKKKKEARGA